MPGGRALLGRALLAGRGRAGGRGRGGGGPRGLGTGEPPRGFRFEVERASARSGARAGRLVTPHGEVSTPGFVAVGTNAALKAVDLDAAAACGQQLMFVNTLHMMLAPGGAGAVARAGGLHRFMARSGPLITDSGGFQVFSMAHASEHDELKRKRSSRPDKKGARLLLRVDEEGALFRSYRDGSLLHLTPEASLAAQKDLGADIILPLDELPPYHTSELDLEQSVGRSHRWEARSLAAHRADPRLQAMYGIVHGGISERLRRHSAQHLARMPFDGFAIGGSIGKGVEELLNVLRWVCPELPSGRPRHLLGVADEPGILAAVPFGVDTFDSAFPTQLGRHGTALTRREGRLRIKQRRHAEQLEPLDPECPCPTCTRYSRAYLHHLYKAKEPVLWTHLSLHNIQHMNLMMARIRQGILDGKI